MSPAVRGRRRAAAAGAVGLALTAGLVVLPAPPAAAAWQECQQVSADLPRGTSVATQASQPLELLRVADAHRVLERSGEGLGRGVTVAVLDSGISDAAPVRVADRVDLTRHGPPEDFHGTAVAGLIAGAPRPDGGLVGVAPEAALVDVRVYDVRDATTEDEVPVTPGYVVQGLQWVLDNARRTGIDIVNVSLTVQADPRIERLVERLWRAGIIVVAANGNRPQQGDGFASDLAEPRPGEDGASVFFPAGYQRTVAVNATTDGLPNAQPARTYVVANSLVDVAAPTAGAVTYGLNGDSCLLLDVATSWSTAEVSGLLALLKSRFPRERPGQLVTRLLVSADGRLAPEVDSPMTGAGVVQPLEALRRPVHPAEDGDLPVGQVQRDEGPVEAPAAEVDTMAAPRRAALWWGLVGGGVLLLALVLRPALSRPARRP